MEEEWADVLAEFDDGAELHSHQVDPLLGVLATAGGTLTPPLGAPEALATLDRAGIEEVARDFLAGWWPLVAGDLPASLQDSLELHQAAPAGFDARVDFRQVLAGVPVFHPVRISLGRNLEVYQFLGPILTEDAIVEDFAVTADAADFITPLSGVDLDDPNLVPENRRLTIMVEASNLSLVESQVPAGQTWMTSSTRPVNECLEGFPENGGGQMNAPYWSRPAIVLNGGSSDLTKMGRSRSRGVLFHEFGHYFFHYVLGNIDGNVFDDWPWGIGPLQATPFMVGAMDEGLNYYLPSAYMSEWGVPFNLSFAAVHCPEAAYTQKLNRFFLKKTDIAECFDTSGNEGDTCPRSYRYNGPQFELADGISDTMAALETFDWNGTPRVRILLIDLNTNPTGDPRYVDGYTLADEAEAALDAQGWCDYAVTWTPGVGAHGDAFPGAGGFRIEVASNPADDCDEVTSVDFLSQADPSSVLPTMGFLGASHYLASESPEPPWPQDPLYATCSDDFLVPRSEGSSPVSPFPGPPDPERRAGACPPPRGFGGGQAPALRGLPSAGPRRR
ncbi:hypothetical protein L6R50_12065 [Myxococcota bacterium]|nr:hypothetical protein [Myxococcota bacterium]